MICGLAVKPEGDRKILKPIEILVGDGVFSQDDLEANKCKGKLLHSHVMARWCDHSSPRTSTLSPGSRVDLIRDVCASSGCMKSARSGHTIRTGKLPFPKEASVSPLETSVKVVTPDPLMFKAKIRTPSDTDVQNIFRPLDKPNSLRAEGISKGEPTGELHFWVASHIQG